MQIVLNFQQQGNWGNQKHNDVRSEEIHSLALHIFSFSTARSQSIKGDICVRGNISNIKIYYAVHHQYFLLIQNLLIPRMILTIQAFSILTIMVNRNLKEIWAKKIYWNQKHAVQFSGFSSSQSSSVSFSTLFIFLSFTNCNANQNLEFHCVRL